jgi:hypothetical protein
MGCCKSVEHKEPEERRKLVGGTENIQSEQRPPHSQVPKFIQNSPSYV